MSMDARDLIGMLFTPGLLEEEIGQNINVREGRGISAAKEGGEEEGKRRLRN